jgi:hypothetical protein
MKYQKELNQVIQYILSENLTEDEYLLEVATGILHHLNNTYKNKELSDVCDRLTEIGVFGLDN